MGSSCRRHLDLQKGATAQKTPTHKKKAAGVVLDVGMDANPCLDIVWTPSAIKAMPAMMKATPKNRNMACLVFTGSGAFFRGSPQCGHEFAELEICCLQTGH